MWPERPRALDPDFASGNPHNIATAVPQGEAGSQDGSAVEHHCQVCPTCGQILSGHHCKLVCNQCGYYMSCADYY